MKLPLPSSKEVSLQQFVPFALAAPAPAQPGDCGWLPAVRPGHALPPLPEPPELDRFPPVEPPPPALATLQPPSERHVFRTAGPESWRFAQLCATMQVKNADGAPQTSPDGLAGKAQLASQSASLCAGSPAPQP